MSLWLQCGCCCDGVAAVTMLLQSLPDVFGEQKHMVLVGL